MPVHEAGMDGRWGGRGQQEGVLQTVGRSVGFTVRWQVVAVEMPPSAWVQDALGRWGWGHSLAG